MKKHPFGWMAIAALFGIADGMAVAADLDANVNLLNNGLAEILLQGGDQNVSRTDTANFYKWGDRHGDGTDVAVNPPGLNMGSYHIINSMTASGGAHHDILLDLNGGNLTATTGYIRNDARVTKDIIIRNVGDIAMQDGYIWTTRPRDADAGDIRIGQDGTEGPRAGNIQLASLESRVDSTRAGVCQSGEIVIHGSGNVLIEDGEGNAGTLVSGVPHDWSPSATDNREQRANDVYVSHHGRFRVGRIDVQSLVGNNSSHQVTVKLVGSTNSVAQGAFEADIIDTRGRTMRTRQVRGNHVVISNYTSLVVGEIKTGTYEADGSAHAGNLTIGGILGNIDIGGIDASAWAGSTGDNGEVMLQAGGTITLADLDLSRVKFISFNAGDGVEVAGLIVGADGEPLSGADGALDNGANLHLPEGQTMTYDPEYNEALDGGTYVLTGGGQLKAWQATGTVIRFR